MDKKIEHNIDSIMHELSDEQGNNIRDASMSESTKIVRFCNLFDKECIPYESISKEMYVFANDTGGIPNVIMFNKKFEDFFDKHKMPKDVSIFGCRCIFADIEKDFRLCQVLDKDSPADEILKIFNI